MESFENLDYIIVLAFFITVVLIGLFSNRNKSITPTDFILSNRNVGLFLFVLTNVSTWYGGVLGISEFTYNYGLASITTQGLPYYFFAILFAFLFAKKIRASEQITIPEKILSVYSKKVALITACLIFIIVSPAPYLLMISVILNYFFGIGLFNSLILSLFFTLIYLIKNGYKSDLYTDAFEFFIMFAGFIVGVFFAVKEFGTFDYLKSNLPETHLSLTGGASPLFILVWFFIALWTFADPGFHQRSAAAKNKNVAFWGIIISVAFWFLFDLLTNLFGLYARASIPNIDNPSNAFLYLANKILPAGFKGLFYAALFATILSTLNSFLFISGTTFGNDIMKLISRQKNFNILLNTRIGLVISGVIALILAYSFPSVIELWYLIGSVCIPGLIFVIFPAYYTKYKLNDNLTIIGIFLGVASCLIWFVIRYIFPDNNIIQTIEPMLFGIFILIIYYLYALKKTKRFLV